MKKIFTILLLTGFIFALHAQDDQTLKYRDLLNIKNIPDSAKGISSFAFFDLGSWFGFALPPDSAKDYRASFIGPYLVSDGIWLGNSFIKFNIKDMKDGYNYNLADAQLAEISYYPGQLYQKYIINKNIHLEIFLIFISSRTAVVKAQMYCLNEEMPAVKIGWSGNVFENAARLSFEGNELSVKLRKSGRTLYMNCYNELIESEKTTEYNYSLEYKTNLPIYKNKMTTVYLFVSQIENETERKNEKAFYDDFITYPKKYFSANKSRWNNYIAKALNSKEDWYDETSYQRGAVKCLLTLMNNWKSPLGALRHEGIVPSYSHFKGFWAWDSWKHSAALAYLEPELAKNQMRAMFDFQNSKGMVADCVFPDSTKNNWLDTKPPLSAWAAWTIYEATADKQFLKEMYPKIVKYHKWWYDERDNDKNGLCEYGATQNNPEAAKWESGMDNAIRFDEISMLKNNDNAYSMDIESVDLNSYLYAEKLYLSKMAEALGLNDDSAFYVKDAGQLLELFQKYFWDKKNQYFFDIKVSKKILTSVYGPEGWMPLWAKAATPEQALLVKNLIYDSDKFYTRVPFATAAFDNPKKDLKGYWRGPVWLDQSYFGIVGLRNYNFAKDAKKLTKKTFERIEGYLDSDKPIRENYNPVTGEGLEATNFSWSAAHLLLLWWGK